MDLALYQAQNCSKSKDVRLRLRYGFKFSVHSLMDSLRRSGNCGCSFQIARVFIVDYQNYSIRKVWLAFNICIWWSLPSHAFDSHRWRWFSIIRDICVERGRGDQNGGCWLPKSLHAVWGFMICPRKCLYYLLIKQEQNMYCVIEPFCFL